MSNVSSINLKDGSSLKIKKQSVKEKNFNFGLNNQYEEIDYSQNIDKYNDLAEDFINVTGDINGDGKVTIKDKSLLEKYINDGTILNEYDVNGDGLTNAIDVKTIESYLINDDALHSYFDLNDLSKPEKVHSVDNLNNMLDSIEKRIKEAKEKKDELENSIWWDKTIQGNFDFLFHDGNRELRISQTELEISKLEEEISFLNSLKNQTETSIKLQPFDEIKASYEFQKYYREHKDDEINIMFEYGAVQDEVNPYERDVNQYLTQEQKVLYQFLLEKEGKTKSSGKAAEYLDALKDSVNQVKGAKLADEYLSSLNLDDEGKVKEDLWNIFCTSGQGLGDGIRTFHEGIKNIIDNGDTLTAEDYKKMIILQYLSENSDILEGTYEFSSSFGNMVPSLVASAIVSYVATPAAGSVVGSVLMGASAGGNAKHQALVKGNSVEASTLYGIFSGTSEAVLGYYLGKIPGISKMSGLTLGNLLSEGAEEYLQEWVDAGLQAVILGEDVDWHDVPKNAEKSFIMGILMAGFMNGGQKVVEVTINGVKRKINVEQTIDYMSKHPDATAEELINLTEKQTKLIEIGGRTSLDSTVEIVSVSLIEKLLTDKNLLSKFLDYNNNTSLFSNSKQSIIAAVEEYVKLAQNSDNGLYLSDIDTDTYNAIMGESIALKSFDSLFTNGEFEYYLRGIKPKINGDFINNTLFTDEGFSNMLNFIESRDSIIGHNHLAPFRTLYLYVKENDTVLDGKTMERIETLNAKYLEVVNTNREILGQYSEYGANQHAVMEVAKNPSLNKKLYKSLESIVKKYFPTIKKSNINKLLRGIDVKGVCSYATVVNELLVEYDGREEQFKKDFGFDLYRIENGKRIINAEEIITDLYCFANQNNPTVFYDSASKQYIGTDSDAVAMSYHKSGKNDQIINAWLQSKGIKSVWSSNVMFSNDVAGIGDAAVDVIRSKISTELSAGDQVELDFFSDKSNPVDIKLYSLDGKESYDISATHHAFGHSVAVTGITESGDIIISSWGKEYYVKFEDLKKMRITVISNKLISTNY